MANFIGVDVGTGSVRAALVNDCGKVLKTAVYPIKTWNESPDIFEQSSDDIWDACCITIKDVCKGVDPQNIRGIGFDATCSLVAVDKEGLPLTISLNGNNEQNIIMWLDHRAHHEAKFVNDTQHRVLQNVGGKISLEMQVPKLMWLKKNLKQTWDNSGMFFDLPDYLTWKATGCDSRSLCSLVCKWTYEILPNGAKGFNKDFFKKVDLDDLLEDNCKKIGNVVLPPGAACGNGLSEESAKVLGLRVGTPVGISIIDAHAGGLGMIGCSSDNLSSDFDTKLGLICGTSTCHMVVSSTPKFVPGVWGPYYNAMVTNMWLNEGGQSATGKLIDHIIESHPATVNIKKKLPQNMNIQEYLSNMLTQMALKSKLPCLDVLTQDIHIWPDFHGNRSPLADPDIKGMISGLTLSSNEDNLAILYLACIQALSYGTKHILDTLKESGHKDITSVVICGGLSRNPLFIQTQADVVNLPVLCPYETESVLLGSAILGACAAGVFLNMCSAIQSMSGNAKVIRPSECAVKYHLKKYQVFLKMIQHQREYSDIMNSK